jgi:hypothetical protein
MKLDTNALLKAGGIGAGAMLVLSLLARVPFVGIVCCCLVYLGYAAIGVGYGYFAKQNGTPISAGSVALGGAIAAGIGGVLAGLVNGIGSYILFSSGGMVAMLGQLQQAGLTIPPETYQMYQQPFMGPLIAVMGFCFAIVIGAVIGAIGGAIYGGTQGNAGPAGPGDVITPAV